MNRLQRYILAALVSALPAGAYASTDHWIYDADVVLYDDFDSDGFYRFISVRIDADSLRTTPHEKILRAEEDFLSEIGIARNILANRLTRMVDAGIMTRRPCDHDKRKVEYQLTEKGADLLTTIVAMRQWGEKWETGVVSNPVLADARDRQPIAKIVIQSHDGRELGLEDLCWIDEAELRDHASNNSTDRADINVRHLREINEPSAA